MLRFTSIRAAVERCDCSLLFVDTVRTTVNYNHSVQEKVCTQCVPAAEMCALGRIARRMDWALHAASYKTLWAAVAKIYGVHRSVRRPHWGSIKTEGGQENRVRLDHGGQTATRVH